MKITAIRALLFAASFAVVGCSSDADDDPMKTGRCSVDTDCVDAEYCNLTTNACAAIPADLCTDDGSCGAGETCAVPTSCATRDVCIKTCGPRSCTGNGECDTRVCVDGLCADPPACDNGTCPTGLVCDATSMTCVEPGGPCAMDTDCPTAGDICVGGQCGPPVSCQYSRDCPTDQRCIQGECRDPCTTAAECAPDPMFWMCDTLTGECAQQCIGDQTCANGFICEGQLCIPAECTMDSDCTGAMERCEGAAGGRGRCVEIMPCDPNNPADCPMNFECIAGECSELAGCRGDRDCPAGRFCEDRHCQVAEGCMNGNCPPDFDCIGDRCVPAVCRGDASCTAPQICIAGECVDPNDGSTVTGVEILTTSGVVSTGTTLQFRAIATNTAGNIVPGVVFEWMSSDTAVAAIDTAGLATGGANEGTTNIVASVNTGVMTVSSQPVALVNLAASAEIRVFVMSEAAGTPVMGATVVCGASTVVTDANGLASFALTAPIDCSVFDSGHDYVTVFGLTGDATVRLPVKSATDRSTGMTGAVDFSQINGADPVEISFSGASFASPLSELTPLALFGGNLFTFDLPVVGAIELPAGTTAEAEVMGFPFSIKDTFVSETKPGRRTAWSFGGLAGLADIGIGGGGDILTNLLPLLQTFSHGTTGQVTALTPLPRIVDSADVDGDGDTTELVPDYASFAPAPMAPDTAQHLRYQIAGDAAAMPTGATALLLISGVIVPRLGFVPLGLDGLAVGANVGSFSTGMAPPHDGLEVGAYAVVAAATDGVANVMSAQMVVMNELPTEVSLDGGWLEFPTATYDDASRLISVTTTGDVWRARFSGTTGSWVVVAPAGSASITLPTPPTGFDDHAVSSAIFVEDLDVGGQTTSALFGVGVDGETQNRAVVRFSQQAVR